MRITADLNRCKGIAMCEVAAPSLFSVTDDGFVSVLKPDVPDGDREQAKLAVSMCPSVALALEDD